MSALVSTRVGGRRGGIVKRTFGSRFRVDRDGDLDMDAPQNGRGKGRGGGGPKRSDGRSISIYNAPKENISNQTARGGSGAMRTGAKRQSGRGPVGTRLLPKASGSRNGQSRGYTGPVVGIRVTGWHKGRGSFHSCSRFLENKTTLKFIKVRYYPPLPGLFFFPGPVFLSPLCTPHVLLCWEFGWDLKTVHPPWN
jgi:hypothetical protein